MERFSHLSLLSKTIICVVATMLVGQLIGSFIYINNYKDSAIEEMHFKAKAIARIAENARNAQARLLAENAINSSALLIDAQNALKGKIFGSEDFFRALRETTYYRTIPVVAAFSAATPGASESFFSFKPTRFDPRNKEYAPKSKREIELLRKVQEVGVDEVSGLDEDENVFRYFRSVKLSKDCLVCHGRANDDPDRPNTLTDPIGFKKDEKSAGDKHGAFQVIIDLKLLDSQIASVEFKVILASILVLLVSLGLVFVVIKRSVVVPVMRLTNDMNSGAEEVNSASQEVSAAAQNLAEGANTQASSLSETSSSLEEISSMSKQNAEAALNAAEISKDCQAGAKEAGVAMDKTIIAMNEIDEGTQKMHNIIKTIDEIAFQTNLLALNAAVEAARAGEAGKGFAVVAEEVRNLAQRSAAAAKDTTTLIEENVSRAQEGSQISKSAGEILKTVVDEVEEVAKLLDGINNAANEQSVGIIQVNKAVASMDSVTQQNAATAEESAAASEQLTAQAENLKNMVQQMVNQINGNSVSSQDYSPKPKAVKALPPKGGSFVPPKKPVFKPTFTKTPQPTSQPPKSSGNKMHDEIIPMDDDFKDF
ncbi:MAG: DUF3365 domain-containing protein [Nitrospinae bacterium]|nr:DUF3365 domain-containing protein [Nitrospinota bacterium]